jgi:catechol 2,3-dioxygenase-like lactoylglutathione lyase family enzyme
VPAPPPVTGISELVLEAQDLERSAAFYRDVLGFEETLYGEGRTGERRWYLVGDAARLGLWSPQEGLGGGRGGAHVHFAFHVPMKGFERIVERLGEHGLESKEVNFSGERAVFVTDPDGNVVEFWTQDMAEYAAGAREQRDTSTRPG